MSLINERFFSHRPKVLLLHLFLLCPCTFAQTSGEPAGLELAGNRFAPLEYAEMDEQQRAMVRHILEGPRSTVRGPFNMLLRSPVMGDLAQELGAYIRYGSVLPDALREMAIIMTAAHWRAEYEWYRHKEAALEAGLDTTIIDAIAARERPARMQPDEAVLFDFCDELLRTQRVSDRVFAAAIEEFGEQGVVDITGTLGYYGFVSLMLNVDEHPLPEGATPQFDR
jgi:4-carboxymuconolactone decarboxylase